MHIKATLNLTCLDLTPLTILLLYYPRKSTSNSCYLTQVKFLYQNLKAHTHQILTTNISPNPKISLPIFTQKSIQSPIKTKFWVTWWLCWLILEESSNDPLINSMITMGEGIWTLNISIGNTWRCQLNYKTLGKRKQQFCGDLEAWLGCF